jgi:hypothetical protein
VGALDRIKAAYAGTIVRCARLPMHQPMHQRSHRFVIGR